MLFNMMSFFIKYARIVGINHPQHHNSGLEKGSPTPNTWLLLVAAI